MNKKGHSQLKLPIYFIDAFTENVFQGNPAAVVIVRENLTVASMQSIAAENNLSETAYVNITASPYLIRCFTPTVDVDLCGHATLASAFVIFSILKNTKNEIVFKSKSGVLKVKQMDNGFLEMDFPSQPPIQCSIPKQINQSGNRAIAKRCARGDYFDAGLGPVPGN